MNIAVNAVVVIADTMTERKMIMQNIIVKKKAENSLILETVSKKASHKANAIKTKEAVDEIINDFIDSNKLVYACLFVVGINTGSRISDLIKYRVCDVLDESGEIEDEITMVEQKTKKHRTVYFNKAAKLAFKIMLSEKKYPDEWIFTHNENKKAYITTLDGRKLQKPITRQSAWNNIMNITKDMDGHYSTHAMRKTFANFFCLLETGHTYVDGRNVAALTKALNHSDSKVTMTYMDIQAIELANMYNSLNLGYEVLKEYIDKM